MTRPRAPRSELQCTEMRDAVAACYEGLEGAETLACADAVDAYVACADGVMAKHVHLQ